MGLKGVVSKPGLWDQTCLMANLMHLFLKSFKNCDCDTYMCALMIELRLVNILTNHSFEHRTTVTICQDNLQQPETNTQAY